MEIIVIDFENLIYFYKIINKLILRYNERFQIRLQKNLLWDRILHLQL